MREILSKFLSSKHEHFFDCIDSALVPLLDMRILHVLKQQYKDQKTIFIVMGNGCSNDEYRIDTMSGYLIQLGYSLQCMYETENNMIKGNLSNDLFDALTIREVFQGWGITIEGQKKTIANHLFAIKNYIEQKNLHYILNDATLIGIPLGCSIALFTDALPLKNVWSKALIALAMVVPCLKVVESLIEIPISRKNML